MLMREGIERVRSDPEVFKTREETIAWWAQGGAFGVFADKPENSSELARILRKQAEPRKRWAPYARLLYERRRA